MSQFGSENAINRSEGNTKLEEGNEDLACHLPTLKTAHGAALHKFHKITSKSHPSNSHHQSDEYSSSFNIDESLAASHAMEGPSSRVDTKGFSYNNNNDNNNDNKDSTPENVMAAVLHAATHANISPAEMIFREQQKRLQEQNLQQEHHNLQHSHEHSHQAKTEDIRRMEKVNSPNLNDSTEMSDTLSFSNLMTDSIVHPTIVTATAFGSKDQSTLGTKRSKMQVNEKIKKF